MIHTGGMQDPFLTVTEPAGKTFHLPLVDDVVRIGRDGALNLSVEDALLSPKHARIERRGENFVLVDEGSRNGTFIDGKRVTPGTEALLRVGSVVTLGLTKIIFSQERTEKKTVIPVSDGPKKTKGFSLKQALGGDDAWPKALQSVVVRLSEEVLPETEPNRMLPKLLRLLATEIGAGAASVHLMSRDTWELAAAYPSSNSVTVTPLNAWLEAGVAATLIDDGVAIAAPLSSPLGVIGVLVLERSNKKFSQPQLALAAFAASFTGPALYQAQKIKAVLGESLHATARVSGVGERPYLRGDALATTRMRTAIAEAATTERSVWLRGAEGTGKECAARAIHAQSKRASRPFVAIPCAAYDEQRALREILGDVTASKPSAIQLALGGTLYLDDVYALSENVQRDLALILKRGSGESSPRLIVATTPDRVLHPDLAALTTVKIDMPTLADRREDLPELAQSFLEEHSRRSGKKVKLSNEALEALEKGKYTRHLRDLSNVIERAVILVEDGGAVEARHVAMVMTDEITTGTLKGAVGEFERAYVMRVLADHKDNRTHTARALGLSRQALIEKLRRYGLVEPASDE